MKKVLILNPYYFPGYRSGGPQQTIKNITDVYGDSCEFYILTQNHDLGEMIPYDGIEKGKWIPEGKAKVKYLSPFRYDFANIKKEYLNFKTIYTCGLFEKNTRLILLIHRFLLHNQKKIYVAPMGVFSKGAINAKRYKKFLFLYLYRVFGAFRNIIWSFSSQLEMQDACNALGVKCIGNNYVIAEDLPRYVDFDGAKAYVDLSIKVRDKLRIIFLSRICAKKNLRYCLQILNFEFDGTVEFDIYGVKEDMKYWKQCEEEIQKLPENVRVTYCGEVKPEEVIDIFRKYDIFLFPTKGENYGHVIYEALAVGCIPILSDQTPWKDLDEFGCGYNIQLDNVSEFRRKMLEFLKMETDGIKKIKGNAVMYAKDKYWKSVGISGYRNIFGDY